MRLGLVGLRDGGTGRLDAGGQAARRDPVAHGSHHRRRARRRFVEALGTLKLTPGTVGDAELTKAGSLVFPITGGNVKYYKPGTVSPYVQGEIDHEGSGFSLTGGGKKVELTDFVIDPGKSVLTGNVSVDGKEAAKGAPLFFLDGRTLEPLKANDNGTAVLEGTTVKLKQEAADLLNQTFGTDALKAGLVIGVAKITVNTA